MKAINWSYINRTLTLLVSCLALSFASFAQEKPFDRIVVFGTSLSDPGNGFVLLSDPYAFGFDESCEVGTPANVPPYDSLDELVIPDGTYARGGHHVTNGATWIEQLARGRGLSGNVRPALRNPGLKASNYAVGGARASDYSCRFNLANQLEEYLADFPTTSANALVVIEMGGNDVRDALVSQDPVAVITEAIDQINTTIQSLYFRGARKFLLVNVPAIGQTPAIQTLNNSNSGLANWANYLAGGFNDALALLQVGLNFGLPDADIRTLDLYALLNNIIANPSNYGITTIDRACVTPNKPPFACKKPDTYLFWDGIHPTKAVHGFMADEAAEVLDID
ncbi:MAG: SGNH/GDSL hydrolase family protein [Methylicorpusculum sp.]|uniref:SGNH/GDSL hydrolase family protein n=1 Tax=Methylicorpusculum sp. TaxID=2713644 RepID=UPI00271BA989|nr:SGNH/GDSL hydrolase family protein [Methylicorpusculum sp.]MDO8939305.1 SGNH/GDSL hydrolase family protein [Methylicorpusculum sp.]MDP2201665.1 SGNH/GDSL hydrolase family protein [Methylicorpusculum sp.]